VPATSARTIRHQHRVNSFRVALASSVGSVPVGFRVRQPAVEDWLAHGLEPGRAWILGDTSELLY
jgi:hypothetical protein